MEFENLKAYLLEGVKKYSKKDFDFFLKLYEADEKLNEQFAGGSCQLVCRVHQFFEEGEESWLDVFVHLYDNELEIGSNIVFHRDGRIEYPQRLYLHRFEGLPRPIMDLE